MIVWCCSPYTTPIWPRKLSPMLGRQTGLKTERSTLSSANWWSSSSPDMFSPSFRSAMSIKESVKPSWTRILLTLVCLLVNIGLMEILIWPQVRSCISSLWSQTNKTFVGKENLYKRNGVHRIPERFVKLTWIGRPVEWSDQLNGGWVEWGHFI